MASWLARRSRRASPAIRAALRGQDGVALVVALITIVVMLLFTSALVIAAMTETLSAQMHEDSGRALNVAEAGAARAIGHALRFDRDWADAAEATAGDCGTVAIGGVTWLVLRDTARNICLRNVPYPGKIAVVEIPAAAGPPAQNDEEDAACASPLANFDFGLPPPEAQPSPGRQIGTYTVLFHPTLERGGGALTVRAIGRVGRAARGIEFLARRKTAADFVVYSAVEMEGAWGGPARALSIHGTIYVRGDWDLADSAQYNDRPVTTADAASPPYENETFVCNDLYLENASIGRPGVPMKGVHVAGDLEADPDENARIYAHRMSRAVPDIRLPDIDRQVRCIGGALPRAECDAEFGSGMWRSHTNHLAADGMAVVAWDGARFASSARADLPTAPARVFLLPRRNRVAECVAAANANLRSDGRLRDNGIRRAVMAECALFYDRSATPETRLYVAGGQVIYIPGRAVFSEPVVYRVDNDPDAAQTKRDTSVLVVAYEARDETSDDSLVVNHRFLAWNRGSERLRFAETDLLAFLVSGQAMIRGPSVPIPAPDCKTPTAQEINGVFAVGGEPGGLDMNRAHVFGALIAREILLDEAGPPGGQFNLRWCQIPDLQAILNTTLGRAPNDPRRPTVLGQVLNNPQGSTVVMLNWREAGF
jgi:hypothetical protein